MLENTVLPIVVYLFCVLVSYFPLRTFFKNDPDYRTHENWAAVMFGFIVAFPMSLGLMYCTSLMSYLAQ